VLADDTAVCDLGFVIVVVGLGVGLRMWLTWTRWLR
jgi:hypothetical protein